MTEPTVEVIVGRIGRAHGIRGELTIEPRTDEPERRFRPGVTLREEGGSRRLTVAGRRWHSGRLLVRFDEVSDRNRAEEWRGVLLVAAVPVAERPAGAGEFWDRELIGLTVLTMSGAVGGVVRRVEHGPQDLLVVQTPRGDERLVPFVEQLVPTVDLAGGTLTLADVAGLLSDEEDQ